MPLQSAVEHAVRPLAVLLLALASATSAIAQSSSLREVDEQSLIDGGARHLTFDTDPDGQAIPDEFDVSKTYIAYGCRISASLEDSFPATRSYQVREGSGQCCANLNPAYAGALILHFCEPGNEERAATVSKFGVAVSFVVPKGTKIEFYDQESTMFAELESDQRGVQFFAVQSETPIAFVKIRPVARIDPDFAIDDLMFDRPVPIDE